MKKIHLALTKLSMCRRIYSLIKPRLFNKSNLELALVQKHLRLTLDCKLTNLVSSKSIG